MLCKHGARIFISRYTVLAKKSFTSTEKTRAGAMIVSVAVMTTHIQSDTQLDGTPDKWQTCACCYVFSLQHIEKWNHWHSQLKTFCSYLQT